MHQSEVYKCSRCERHRASNNRNITLAPEELDGLSCRILRLDGVATANDVIDRTVHQDILDAAPLLPNGFASLMILDPPYNLDKQFGYSVFKQRPLAEYAAWLDEIVAGLLHCLAPTATVYVCADWQSSPAVFEVVGKHFQVRNRITWEREKGRGSKRNWKQCSEDIWFCTLADTYEFNVEDVMLRRKVLAPYTSSCGAPKDWEEKNGLRFRDTHPSNIWTDITVPFWSMPENTCHPAQKPEKLFAKLVLASSKRGGIVLDPFLGSGTTSVVAKKLGRHYVGVEINEHYCCLAEKRLAVAETCNRIQGYEQGVFWERNSLDVARRFLGEGSETTVTAPLFHVLSSGGEDAS